MISHKSMWWILWVDIMWCLCVEVKIQQRVIWFCKASLRICYLSLFECKVPWMLKTDSLSFTEILNISEHNKFCGAVWRKYGKQEIEDCLLSKSV